MTANSVKGIASESASSQCNPAEIMQQAAEWHVLMQSGEAEEADRRQFEIWRQCHRNATAYAELEAVWQRFDPVASRPAREALQFGLEKKPAMTSRSKKPIAACCGAAMLALCSALVMQSRDIAFPGARLTGYLSPAYLFSDYRTGIGQQKVIELSDNTRVVLNTFSAIDVEYSAERRVIRLVQGEVRLDVAGDPGWPLTVHSKHGRATALGTQFSVYDQGRSTDVSVTESRVRICAEQDALDAHCKKLGQGQTVSVQPDVVAKPGEINAGFEHDWSTRRLIVNDQPLVNVLDELNRYQHGVMRMDRNALSSYRVSGVFPLDNPEAAMAILEQSLPLNIELYLPFLTLVSKK